MVKSLLALLNTRQNSILSGAVILMVAVFGSKILGLVKDRFLVHNFDTSEAAIFFGAFRLPDLIFQLLIFGTLSVAFIPVFTILGTLAFIFAPALNSLLVPGFLGQQKLMTDELTRIILFGQLLMVIGSFFMGINQSFQRFIIPALAPLMYNLGIIFGIAVLAPYFGIAGAAYGVVIGSLLHMLIQFPLAKSLGFQYSFSLDFLNQGVREIFQLMSLRNLSLMVEQLNETVSIALASLISYSSVTLLTFSQTFMLHLLGF